MSFLRLVANTDRNATRLNPTAQPAKEANSNNMETKHTKGEWVIKNQIAEYDGYSNMWYVAICLESDRILQRIYGATKSEAEANAKLMAAAPIMLKALLEWQAANALGDAEMLSQARITRDIAIRKATE
jgi:hypothetical protein